MSVINPAPIGTFSFERPSTATYINGSGVVTSVAANVRRPNFIGAVQSGYMYEPAAATNLISQSNAIVDSTGDVMEEGFERLGLVLESIAGHVSKSTRSLERGEVLGFPVRTIAGQPIQTVT